MTTTFWDRFNETVPHRRFLVGSESFTKLGAPALSYQEAIVKAVDSALASLKKLKRPAERTPMSKITWDGTIATAVIWFWAHAEEHLRARTLESLKVDIVTELSNRLYYYEPTKPVEPKIRLELLRSVVSSGLSSLRKDRRAKEVTYIKPDEWNKMVDKDILPRFKGLIPSKERPGITRDQIVYELHTRNYFEKTKVPYRTPWELFVLSLRDHTDSLLKTPIRNTVVQLAVIPLREFNDLCNLPKEINEMASLEKTLEDLKKKVEQGKEVFTKEKGDKIRTELSRVEAVVEAAFDPEKVKAEVDRAKKAITAHFYLKERGLSETVAERALIERFLLILYVDKYFKRIVEQYVEQKQIDVEQLDATQLTILFRTYLLWSKAHDQVIAREAEQDRKMAILFVAAFILIEIAVIVGPAIVETLGKVPWEKIGSALWKGLKWTWGILKTAFKKLWAILKWLYEHIGITPEEEPPVVPPVTPPTVEEAKIPWALLVAGVGLLLLATAGE